MENQGTPVTGIPGLGLLRNPPKSEKLPPAQAERTVPAPVDQRVHPPEHGKHSGKQADSAQPPRDAKPLGKQKTSCPAVTEATGISYCSDAPMKDEKEEVDDEKQEVDGEKQEVDGEKQTVHDEKQYVKEESPPYSPSLFGKLEASLAKGSRDAGEQNECTPESAEDTAMPDTNLIVPQQGLLSRRNQADTAMADAPEGDMEFKADSSPYESSSDDSSDDSSSEDDEPYSFLTPEEQAKILMNGDHDSDDEKNAQNGGGQQIRTKHEVPEEVITKPDITITPEMKILELGKVESIVEHTAVIVANTTGEYQVLESDSVLCLEDRSVIGVVSDTLGPVQQPLYCVRFTNSTDITESRIAVGTKIFYCEQHSSYVFTQALKGQKGTDASNLWDEEVAEDEQEFSDDEAEMEHKRRLKEQRRERGGRQADRASNRNQQRKDNNNSLVAHDDIDGPYKTLTRPASFAENIMRPEAPQEDESGRSYHPNRYNNSSANTGRGGGGGRADRGRGGRGRGRGYDRGGQGEGYSLPPRPQGCMAQSSPSPSKTKIGFGHNQRTQQQVFPPIPQQPWVPPNIPSATSGPQYYFPNEQQGQQQQWPQQPPMSTGAFFNPAFFGAAPQAQPQSQPQTQASQQQ